MTTQENQTETIHPTNQLEDLNLQETDASDIKGGPAYMKLGDIKGETAQAAPQTREPILLAR